MQSRAQIRRAQSYAVDPREAVRDFHATVSQPEMTLVIFFCSTEYDLDVIAEEMRHCFKGIQVVGCTTAGEIGPAGYRTHSISGASFAAGGFAAVCNRLKDLQQFEIAASQGFVQEMLQSLESRAPQTSPDNSFAFLLIDGLSVREEPVAHALQQFLGNIPLVGGSAADGLTFGRTLVYIDGHFYCDSAILILVTTPLPFRLFKTQHFVAMDKRIVVTEADPEHRLVHELDGRPAAEAYAELVGVNIHELDSMRFAASPVVVVIDGTNYVRSIQKVNADGSLTFFCAIDEGMVLRVARGTDLVDNLERTFAAIRSAIGEPQLVIGCDCILRRQEIVSSNLVERVANVFLHNNAIGFNSYGEQYRGVHVNQTLTGIAIGNAAVAVQNA